MEVFLIILSVTIALLTATVTGTWIGLVYRNKILFKIDPMDKRVRYCRKCGHRYDRRFIHNPDSITMLWWQPGPGMKKLDCICTR